MIERLSIKEFTCFDELNIDFSKNINIISGENGIGKTHILKLLYSVLKSVDEIKVNESKYGKAKMTKEKINELISNKLINVYRTEAIGRLVKRRVGSNKAEVGIQLKNQEMPIHFNFSRQAVNKVNMENDIRDNSIETKPIYLPPKEIISATENFSILYDEYHIAFEETYADLSKLLLLPIKKGKKTEKQNELLKNIEDVIDGNIILKNNKFFLKKSGEGEFEMGLVAEGFRKWATILQLIQNGVLTKNSVLFWDEPETNINPKLIKPTVNLIVALAKMGVQIFVTTHSYFFQQQFNLFAQYEKKKAKIDIKFFSLYKENGDNKIEKANSSSELTHNIILDEFFELYNQEQELFYD